MSKSVQTAAATALLSLALIGSAQANFGGPYAYAGAADVDNLNTLVDELTFFGNPTGVTQFNDTWAQTEMGVHHVVAMGDGSGTRYGAVSAWSDAFTVSGGTGTGNAQVSLSLSGLFGAGSYASAGYLLIKSADLFMPQDLMSYVSGTPLPSGVEVVLWSMGDSIQDAGPVNTVLSGSFSFAYDTPFYLTSVAGVMASGAGQADFANTARFGISVATGDIGTGSGTTYLAAAVPEAHEWALMLVGLGLLGLQVRRRGKALNIAA